jgi:hypothetical protein
MTHQDRSEFAALLAEVLGFYRQQTSPFAMSVWWEACKGFELAQIRQAMTAHALNPDRGHFAPMPADIIRALVPSGDDEAHAAWGKLVEQIRSVGSYGAPKIEDDAARNALVAMGGWGALCRSDERELPFLHKRFVDGYKRNVETARREALAAPDAPRLQ